MNTSPEHILVIKHGALGDIILATACFKAIRAHHPDAKITCLTSKTYANLLEKCPFFDEILVDLKPKYHHFRQIKRLKTLLNSKKWAWIYDLQTSNRTTLYPWLIARPWPCISNISRHTSHGFIDPDRTRNHALENLRLQLAVAGIKDVGLPDIGWLEEEVPGAWCLVPGEKEDSLGDVSISSLPGIRHQAPGTSPFALLVPGGAAHRPEKRWPAEHYARLAQALVTRGIRPVLIGTEAEGAALDAIAAKVPEALNLRGKTSIAQLATLARRATLAVGNDTGPMHIIGASHCPSLVLFSHASDPVRSAPVGESVTVLREPDLAELSVDRVLAACTMK